MDINMVLMSIQDQLPDDPVVMMGLKQRLEGLPEHQKDQVLSRMSLVKLKNPMVGLILSILLGGLGVDRFYVGDIGLGILKLILCAFVIGIIWYFIDVFLVMKRIRQDNYQKLMMII